MLQLELLLRLTGRGRRLNSGRLTSDRSDGGRPEPAGAEPAVRAGASAHGSTAPSRPLLAPWYRLVEDGERLVLEHGRSVVVLEGRAVQRLLPGLLPLLDGSRTTEDVVAAAGLSARPAVEHALELLHANGVLVEGPLAPGGAPAALPLAAAYRLAPSAAEARLREARVGVLGSAASGEHVARILHAAGVGTVERLDSSHPDGVELAVVAPAPAEAPLLREWNVLALDRGVPWLPLGPFDGLASLIGPLVLPGESACHECLLLRLAGHLEWGDHLARIETTPTAAGSLASLEAVAAGIAAQVALCWIGGRDPRVPGILHVLETQPILTLGTHAVLRVPRCPACSTVARLAPGLPWHEAEAA